MAFTEEQTLQLTNSVIFNNKLKTLENYSDTLGNIGIGGFNISTSMWGFYFAMVNDTYYSTTNSVQLLTSTNVVPTELTKA
jgi:hypothetical protein